MVIDAPGTEETDPKSGKGEDVEIELTEDNAQQVMAMINRLNR